MEILSSESGSLNKMDTEAEVAVVSEMVSRPFENIDDYRGMMQDILAIEPLQAKLLGAILIRRYGVPESVIDVGCGPGIYLLPFKDAGSEVFGIDGCAEGGSALGAGEFERIDLRFAHPQPSTRYHFGLCIEVAEHLKEEYADTLVKRLCDCCDTLFFTAAREGQPGTYHYNCQPMTYWLEKFSANGWEVHPDSTSLVEELGTVPEFLRISWLAPNAVLLRRKSK